MGDTTFTYAHFIVDALEGLPRNRFIKSILRTLPGYLDSYSARQEKSVQENGVSLIGMIMLRYQTIERKEVMI